MVAAYKTSYPLHLSSVGDVVEVIRYNSEKYKDALFDIGVLPGSFIGIIKKTQMNYALLWDKERFLFPTNLLGLFMLLFVDLTLQKIVAHVMLVRNRIVRKSSFFILSYSYKLYFMICAY